jgi:hypothetical protein
MREQHLNEARQFLGSIFEFADLNEQCRINTWERGQSFWWFDTDRAAEYVVQRRDIYVGCSTVDVQIATGGEMSRIQRVRGSLESVTGFGALYLDLDIAGPHHKKQNLPKDEAQALQIVNDAYGNITPSLIVRTGHGLHLWWLLSEFWNFEDNEDKEKASKLLFGWQHVMKNALAEHGFTMDSTHDLSRVLRIPGTINAKDPSDQKVVTLHENSDSNKRYDADQFTAYMDDLEAFTVPELPSTAKAKQISGLAKELAGAIDLENSEVDPRQLNTLMMLDELVGPTLNHKRPDLTDDSPSGYDMSLALSAIDAGWKDEQIVGLLRHHRMLNECDMKRPDYYARTIVRARNYVSQRSGNKKIEAYLKRQNAPDLANDEPEQPNGNKPPSGEEEFREAVTEDPATSQAYAVPPKIEPEEREEILGLLSAKFRSNRRKICVKTVIKFMTDPPTYRLITDLGSINLGESKGIMVQKTFRESVAAATSVVIPKTKERLLKNDDPATTVLWDDVAQMLFDICEERYAGEESTDLLAADTWVRDYLFSYPPSPFDPSWYKSKNPFYDANGTYFMLSHLLAYLRFSRNEVKTTRQLGVLLTQSGYNSVTMSDGHVKLSVWRVKDLLFQEYPTLVEKRGVEIKDLDALEIVSDERKAENE